MCEQAVAGQVAGQGAGQVSVRPKARNKRHPLMNQLSPEQVGLFKDMAATYSPDLVAPADPAAVEVLFVLLEVCRVLDLLSGVVDEIFGLRVLGVLEAWGEDVPPRRRPEVVRRAWVWLPNQARPRLYPLENDGTICVREAERR